MSEGWIAKGNCGWPKAALLRGLLKDKNVLDHNNNGLLIIV